MKQVTRTVTFSYTIFEEGDIVRPTSSRCPLPRYEEYVVVRFVEPVGLDEHGTVFVEGHTYGVSAEYLTTGKEVTQHEIR